MLRTVNEGFQVLLSRLTPSDFESDAAKSHRASIKFCLTNNFQSRRFFRTGSFGNATSVSGYSDVDYFSEIPEAFLLHNSATVLSQVRTALDNRFPRSNVYIDCPAVVCPFGTDAKESTEIVPAIYIGNLRNTNFPVYKIPNCSGGWMQSSPDVHNNYVLTVDQNFNGRVKALIRFIKAWKYYRQVPISSFYLELRIAKYAENVTEISYKYDVQRVFAYLLNVNLAQMQDPMGISGYISPCKTLNHLNDALSKLQTAYSRATKAVEEENKRNLQGAFAWWNLLYNENFPSYYYYMNSV